MHFKFGVEYYVLHCRLVGPFKCLLSSKLFIMSKYSEDKIVVNQVLWKYIIVHFFVNH